MAAHPLSMGCQCLSPWEEVRSFIKLPQNPKDFGGEGISIADVCFEPAGGCGKGISIANVCFESAGGYGKGISIANVYYNQRVDVVIDPYLCQLPTDY
jgi:hypothetical protein